jgi:hypothetical protein
MPDILHSIIYPKDYENIEDIDKGDRIRILESDQIIYEVSNSVFGLINNRNFFKFNKNQSQVYILNANCEFDVYRDNTIIQIIVILFKNINILYLMQIQM